jgi:hypothetical protein
MIKGFLSISLAALVGYFSASTAVNYASSHASNSNSSILSKVSSVNVEPRVSTVSTGTSSVSTSSDTTVSNTTTNWAGYVSTGGDYTAVSGSWIVPTVSSDEDGEVSADATWIGIGGVKSDDLIQIGTQNVIEDDQLQTASFYEELPDSSETISTINVSPGDSIAASIKQSSQGIWNVYIIDYSNGESFSNTVSYDSSETSAEWIEEAPSDQSGVMDLDEFDTVNFTGATTTDNGTSMSASASNAQAVTMDNSEGESLTAIGSLSSNGEDFSISRTDADQTESETESNTGEGGYGSYSVSPGGALHVGRYGRFRNF